MNSPTDGPYRELWSNGHLTTEGQSVNGLQEGKWRFYNEDGTLQEIVEFEAGREIVDWERFFDEASPPRTSNDE